MGSIPAEANADFFRDLTDVSWAVFIKTLHFFTLINLINNPERTVCEILERDEVKDG